MNWTKYSRSVTRDGTTVVYEQHSSDIPVYIESRKRHIPHANGTGTWDYTSYFVVHGNEDIKEFHRLRDAKEYAENYIHDTERKGMR